MEMKMKMKIMTNMMMKINNKIMKMTICPLQLNKINLYLVISIIKLIN